MSEGSSHLMNNNAPFPFHSSNGKVDHVQVILHPEELKCWPLTRAELQVCSISKLPQTNEILESFVDHYFCENGNPEEITEHFQNKLK